MGIQKILRQAPRIKAIAGKPAGKLLRAHLAVDPRTVKTLKRQMRKTRDYQIMAMRIAIVGIANQILEDAIDFAPRDTGYLQKSGFVLISRGATDKSAVSMSGITGSLTTGGRVSPGKNVNTKAAQGLDSRGLNPNHYKPHETTIPNAKAFIAKAKASRQVAAAVGFWAEYAVPVHEGANGVKKPFFLRKAVSKHRASMKNYMALVQKKAIRKSLAMRQKSIAPLSFSGAIATSGLNAGGISEVGN